MPADALSPPPTTVEQPQFHSHLHHEHHAPQPQQPQQQQPHYSVVPSQVSSLERQPDVIRRTIDGEGIVILYYITTSPKFRFKTIDLWSGNL